MGSQPGLPRAHVDLPLCYDLQVKFRNPAKTNDNQEKRPMTKRNCFVSLFVLSVLAAALNAQNQRDIAVRKDKQELADDSSWIYDDLDSAFAEAARSKRPLMVVFR